MSTSPVHRTRLVFAAPVILLLLVLLLWSHAASQPQPLLVIQNHQVVQSRPNHLLGAPTRKFRDNLVQDLKYITAWAPGGWTNDVIGYFNLIYLALITDRIPILPPFAPSHIGAEAGMIEFGTVFDVPRLSASIGTPVLEWSQVKDTQSEHIDALGCWSTWAAVNEDRMPRENLLERHLKLDIGYTPTPQYAKLYPNSGDWHESFWGLASLTFPNEQDIEFPATIPSKIHNHTLQPDGQVSCFDFMYFVAALQPLEFRYQYSPTWRFVGNHARWNQTLVDIAFEHLRVTWSLAATEEVPSFISVHIRRNDFKFYCHDSAVEECFASLGAYERRVREVKEELLKEKGLDISRVIVTSDETDRDWWDEVTKLGWSFVDFDAQKTVERYGKWYPPLVDAVLQSSGVGFVGTEHSTMSIMAQLRVRDWHGGLTTAVRWGTKDADAHRLK